MSDELPLGLAARLRGIVRDELEDDLAETAVESGVVSAAEIDELRAESTSMSPMAALVARGRIAEEAVAALERGLARKRFSRPAAPSASAVPSEVEAVASDPRATLGPFVLVQPIRQGATGEVWKAWDRRLARWVALKISTAAQRTAVARERFERELHAAARLAHAHIVPVFEADVDAQGRPYLVMPYIEGRTLDDAGLSLEAAVDAVATAARAIGHAHARGVVHRDVKPGNTMIDETGEVFVLDFGLAHLHELETDTTRPGDVLGTAAYMSPEQARGASHEAHPAMDVYGLGATLYRLVTGRAPFQGGSVAEIIARVANELPPRPRAARPGIDRDLEAIIEKAMAREPARRYATALALADDLSLWRAERPVAAREVGPIERGVRAVGRRPLRAAAVLLGAMAIGLLGAKLAAERTRRAAVTGLAESAALELLRAAPGRAVPTPVRRALDQARRAGATTPDLEQVLDER